MNILAIAANSFHAVRRRKRVAACVLLATVALVAAGLIWPMNVQRYVQVNASAELHDRNGKLLYAFLNADEQWQFPRPLNEISPYLVSATIAVEDQRFWHHRGIDPIAVLRAATQNLQKGRVHSGASTITMQVVKQTDKNDRSLFGKLSQAFQAVRLELRTDKPALLQSYLNGAPYGLNLHGCEAAARRYFGKPSSELTLSEAALLAGLPKSPAGFMPLKHTKNALARRNFVLDRMLQEGFISESDHARARDEVLGVAWHEFPQRAPHLAMRTADSLVPGNQARTTIDFAIQESTEKSLAESLKQFDNEVTNAAAIIVDTSTAEVLARVGSADFYNTPGGGQVDACRAPRSPGSALKPFTYALAMEENKLYPGEMLLDDSLDYGLYNPENYDGEYRGVVTASYALRRSLNVPSVIILERVGYESMHRFLLTSGLTTLVKPAEHYGLGLTLGNCEVRLDQLTAAYCMLANLGEYRSLREFPGSETFPRRLLSRGACLSLYSMLEQEFPTEFHKDIVQAQGYRPRICWKTGTSTGNHDAWAIVFNRHYVVAVWLGNNDGKSSKYLVGARAALPLAQQLFRSLPPKSIADWPVSDGDLREATVCANSGLPISKFCPNPATARIATTQFLNRVCDVHHPRAGDLAKTTQRWPATARGWDLAKVDASVNTLRTGNARKEGLRIQTPSHNSEFVLTGEENGDKIRLRASADAVTNIHWYLNGRHLGTSGPGKSLLLDLSEGTHDLTCMAEAGSTDSVSFTVSPPTPSQNFKSASR